MSNMMGMDFLFKAIGVTDEQIAQLRDFLDPQKVRATADDFRQRFEAMERRNMEMHAAMMQLLAAQHNIAPNQAELAAQLQIVLEGKKDERDAENRDRIADAGRLGTFEFRDDGKCIDVV